MSDQPPTGEPSRPSGATRWVSFVDEEHTTWLFDLTFLTSDWRCTFGSTCPGTEPGDNGARGCCAHGAYLVDADERDQLVDTVNRLDSAHWQNHHHVEVPDDLFETIDGELTTRRVDDACIFLNRTDFVGGHGCALHIGALAAGERPLDWKPAVCWQVPFRLEEYEDGAGTRTVVVRAWRRSDWGEGGEEFAWWCTDALTAGAAEDANWLHHQDELIALVGEWPVQLLNDYLAEQHLGGAEVPIELRRSAREE